MADAKIINYGQQISAGSTAIPDNTSEALDIESTDAKEYITANTTDGSESINLGQQTNVIDGKALDFYSSGETVGGSVRLSVYGAGSAATIRTETSTTDLVLGTNSTERLRIKSDTGIVTMPQDAGIGETSPTSHWPMATTLVVKDTSNAGITICSNASNNQGTLVFADGVASDATSSGGMIQYTHTGDYFRFTAKYNGNSPRADDSGEHVMRCNEYGMGKMRYSTAYDSTARDSAVSTFRPVYLATTSSTNDTLVLDYEHGSIGEITLTNNITAIKVFNAPRHGSAQTMTVKIKQHSTAVTLSYSSVTIYWSTSVTRAGNLLWSGGATHVLSTGNNEIDIVQFTCLPHGDTNRDIYASVIGQNFS